MVENTKHVVRFLQKHIQKIGQNADLNRNKKIWKKVVLKKKCGSYIRIIDQQSTDQKSIFRKKRQRKGIFIMADKMIENNQVVIMGEIVSPVYIQPSGIRRGLLPRQCDGQAVE